MLLGDFEFFFNYFSVIILAVVIYNIINCFTFKNLLRRFGFLKVSRRDFYECGFKSLSNIKVQYNINFILIILFLIIYDGEFLFLISEEMKFFFLCVAYLSIQT